MDDQGRTPLLFAVDCKFPIEIIKQLINDCGCDINAVDNNGDSVLHYAARLNLESHQELFINEYGMK